MPYVPTGGGGSVAIGGTVTGATAGSAFFAGALGVLAQDNTNLFWDDAANKLRVPYVFSNGTSLVLEQTGDATGVSSLTLMNGTSGASYGAQFYNAGIGLFDLQFEASGANTGKIRFEERGGATLSGQASELQLGTQGQLPFAVGPTGSWTKALAASYIPVTIQLAAAQSGDALQVKDNGGTTVAAITKDGFLGLAESTGIIGGTLSIYNLSDTNTGFAFPGSEKVCIMTRGVGWIGFEDVGAGSYGQMQMGNGSQISWSVNNAAFAGGSDTGLARSAAGIVKITDGSTGAGAMQLQEMTAPTAPATNNAIIFAEDNGSGKTRVVVRFPTGADVVLATEA